MQLSVQTPNTPLSRADQYQREESQALAAELDRYTKPLLAVRTKLACGFPVLASMPDELRHAAKCLAGMALEMERIRRDARP
jgi:hypothetical protein